MKTKFDALEKLLRSIVDARKGQKKALADLEIRRKDFSEDGAKLYIDPEINKANGNFSALYNDAFTKAVGILEELKALAIQKQSTLDLTSPALATALKVIELAPGKLDGDMLRKINANFTGNQPVLRVLQAVYAAKGFAYDGGISDQVYEVEPVFDSLKEYAFMTLVQNGSLNMFSTAISKIAAKEGIEFPVMVDDMGFENAARRGAGLKEV